ncbi:MAG: Metal dependent phosphohydrolase [candidate division WS6 bacterium GW2011_GWF2_39_15]|uniref:Metal dependent phosphohydrolase n=1 Tax=candidate division WS6 bacterium GW2011_GWF2_39_15 TaxID=1619100 RepID=A0A0G0MYT6_9BACT|nr:MAG: Metal dependent phosphohydrolase [candidate division WS6 bacterium GW2011_GWF2_39_15]
MTRERAWELVKEYTKNNNLVKHMLAVEAAMRAYAKKFGQDEEKWGVVGLIHDFDYEKMGDQHPSEWGYEILRQEGVTEDMIDAIKGHGLRDDSASRKDNMARALFASDELTGFIVAVALVKPDQLSGVDVKSVTKRFKDKGFARGVVREDIINGAKELNIDLDEHIQLVIDAMKEIKEDLGLK